VTSPAKAQGRDRRLGLVSACLFLATATSIAFLLAWSPEPFDPYWLLWSVLIAAIELLPVPAWRGLTFSVGFPVLVTVAILCPVGAAGVVTFLGALDPREFKREVTLGVALYNRSQVALSVMAASAVFHAFHPSGSQLTDTAAWILIIASTLASIADYAVNAGLVTLYMSTKLGIRPSDMLRQLTIGNVRDFLVGYMGLGLLGLAFAVLFEKAGAWTVPAFLAPLVFARQMFFRSQALEEAHKELQTREQVLRSLSNAMAEERADERLQIAGYLHDDLAQVLFRLSIQVDVARKLLEKGQTEDVASQLEKIRHSKQETSDRIRALIRDLHRSPLGAKGLAEALESFTEEVGRDSSIRVHRDVEDIDLPAPIALLVYHIAREGVMNALKHAQPRDVWIAVLEEDDDIVLSLKDNGVGFDTDAPGPEGHFGMAMMRERAQVGGGRFEVESAPGEGATITVRFPKSLLQPDPPAEQFGEGGGSGPTPIEPTDGRRDGPRGDASPGTPGRSEPAAGDSRPTVRA
jgi:signal transduction histidine kinase